MNGKELFQEEKDMILERFALSMQRVSQIEKESELEEKLQDYFRRTAGFLLQMEALYNRVQQKEMDDWSLEQLKKQNYALYEDILPKNYEKSYGNPTYAVQMLGTEYGQLLSFLYSEIRGMIVFAYEGRLFDITVLTELFIEIYNCLEEKDTAAPKAVKDILYWFVSDYSDRMVPYRIREQLDPTVSFATDLILHSDLTDLRYLYRFGEYITENECRTAMHLNSLPEEAIEAMASTYTEGYRIGFEVGNKDLSKKEVVNIRYTLGFERIVKAAIKNFEKMGLKPTIYRAAVQSINRKQHYRLGYFGAIPNKQFDYDHKEDCAIYLDKAFIERKLGVLKVAYDTYKTQASKFAGPAVIEIFGETPFSPETKKESLALQKKQQKLSVEYDTQAGQIINRYIKGEERSFTIIAYPIPEIGEQYEEIFDEVVKINTLDYILYQKIQQKLIDVLDQGKYVHIKGAGRNKTDLYVRLTTLEHPQKETIFENCVADVNIPVGEVFTSPMLAGTNGTLHVSKVFLNELEYKELELTFTDGKISDYNCENFNGEKENKKYIRQNILYNHETLPMGEFAIGTNTTAYVMAKKYQIADKLPILIAEKMGPHFAVGDTCYSWSEDIKVYNPDGKEIIARDNEISILRKEDISKAYFNCHTDITIPYEELEEIAVYQENGEKTVLISNGRFVLPGTETLNKPFENL